MDPKVLTYLFQLNEYCVKTNTEGITEDDAVHDPDGGGNCCNWVLGHIVATRNSLLSLLGEAPIWDDVKADIYRRGSSPLTDKARALPFKEILGDFQSSQEKIVNALRRISPEDFSVETDGESLGQKLATLQFHEAYHIGQLGLLRRIAGREGAIK